MNTTYACEAVGVLATINGDIARIGDVLKMAMTEFSGEMGARTRQWG